MYACAVTRSKPLQPLLGTERTLGPVALPQREAAPMLQGPRRSDPPSPELVGAPVQWMTPNRMQHNTMNPISNSGTIGESKYAK